MAVGLPGFGLSGAFFVVSALFMLPIEIVSTLRGRSSLARWGGVLRSAGIALAIVAGVELTYAALHLAVTLLSGSVTGARGSLAQPDARTVDVVRTIPVLPILGTLGLVAIVMASAKAAEMLSDLRRKPIRSGSHPQTPSAELRSVGKRRPTPRPRKDLVDARSPRGHVQPHVIEHQRFANELQHQLGLASGRSR